MLCQSLMFSRGVATLSLVGEAEHRLAAVHTTVLKQYSKESAKSGISFEKANELTLEAIQSPKISKTRSWVLTMAGRFGVGER